MSTDNYKNMSEEPPLYLKDSNFKIWAHIADPDFDNNDSRYLKIKMHIYSNLETEEYSDDYVEIIECENEHIDENLVKLWYPGKLWCPDYHDDDIL